MQLLSHPLTHFLRRRISDNRSYFFITRRMVLGLQCMPLLTFNAQTHPCDIRMCMKAFFLLLADRGRQGPHPFPDFPILRHKTHSTRFCDTPKNRHIDEILNIPTDVPMDNSVLCPWLSLPFYGLQKIPQQFILHFQPLVFPYLYSANVFAGLRPRCFRNTFCISAYALAFSRFLYYILVLQIRRYSAISTLASFPASIIALISG